MEQVGINSIYMERLKQMEMALHLWQIHVVSAVLQYLYSLLNRHTSIIGRQKLKLYPKP